MSYQRFIPFGVALVLWLLSQCFLFFPGFFYSTVALGALIIVFSVRYLARGSQLNHWPLFLISPLFFFLTFSIYAALFSGFFWIQAIFLLNAWFMAVCLNSLSHYFLAPTPEREKKLDNLFLNGAWLTVFAASSVIFGLSAFISLRFPILLAAFLLTVLLLWIQFLPLAKVKWRAAAPVLFASIFVLGVLVGAISLLPLNFNILGFLAAIFAYFLLAVNRLFWRGNLSRQTLKGPFIFSVVLSVILLLTARWL